MSVILGIDLGTQSVKAMLLDAERGPICTEAQGYDILVPRIDCAEERASDWWDAVKAVIARLREANPAAFQAISAIGLSGQMHGIVAVDAGGEPVLPAIIWSDQRSKAQVDQIERALPADQMAEAIHNRMFTGFGIPSLLWMKQHRPAEFARIYKVMCPKDFIRMKLIGEIATDMSDASATAGLHMERRAWYGELLEKIGIPVEIMPDCREAVEIAGQVTAAAARETGLRAGTPVVYGSGDMPALLLGSGVCREGLFAVNIGTGATFAAYSALPLYDPKLRVQAFCNAVDGAHVVFGAMLAGGVALSWLKNNVLTGVGSYREIDALAAEVEPGSEGLIFLPYINGERTPHMDYNATGMFFGLRFRHDRRHMIRSVMEGVVFGLLDCEKVLSEIGLSADRIIASGGGAKSPLWLQMQADMLGREISVTRVEEQACLGACIVAGIGVGIFKDAREGCARFCAFDDRVYVPDPATREVYMRRYEEYRALYRANREIMAQNVR